MQFLRQSTAGQEIKLGPFLDSTDGNSAETALTIANTDIKLWKEGATTEVNKNSGGATHIASGRYYAVLDATDSNTLGKLEVDVHVTGALPVHREYMVLPAMVYDSFVLGTDRFDVNVTHVNDTAQAANDNSTDINTLLSRIIGTLAAGTHNPQSGDVFAQLPTNFGDLAVNATTGEVSLTTAQADAIATRVELALLNEADGQAVLQGIADQIAQDWVAGDASPLAIASAVWSAASRTLSGTIQDFDALDTAQDTQHTATQDAIAALASSPGSGSIPYVPSTITVTAGTGASGTAADMANDDAAVYSVQDSAGTLTLDFDYQFAAGIVAIQAIIVVDMQGVGDDVDLQFFDQVGLAYDTIDTISGDNGISYITLDKTIVQKYTTNAGLFQMRFTGTGLSGATLTINKAVVNAVATSTGIANGTTVTLAETTSNQNFIGKNWSLALGGQIIDGSYFEGAKDVTGISSNTNGAQYRFHDCRINSATFDADGVFTECGFVGATFGSTGGVTADDITIEDSGSRIPGASSPSMDFSAVSKTTSANIRGWMGGGNWTFAALITASIEVIKGGGHTVTTNGADVEFRGNPRSLNIVLSGGETVQILAEAGPISISGNGAGSTVNIYGYNSGVTNTATNTPTVSNFSLETDAGGTGITQQQVRDAMKLAPSAGAPVAGSIDTHLDDALTAVETDIPTTLTTIAGYIDTEVQSILDAVSSTGVELSVAQMNQIADHVWRRNLANIRASADGDTVNFRSPLGAASKLVNRVGFVGANLVTREEDDTTAFGTQAATTDPTADPVTELDTA